MVNSVGSGADKEYEADVWLMTEADAYQCVVEDPAWIGQEGPAADALDADGDPNEDHAYDRMVEERLMGNG